LKCDKVVLLTEKKENVDENAQLRKLCEQMDVTATRERLETIEL
jgi:hypothetical protein